MDTAGGFEAIAIEGGWRIAEDDTWYYDVKRMLFNYRVVRTSKAEPWWHTPGYCYVGTEPIVMLLAMAAAKVWCDTQADEPLYWNKNVETGEYREDE